MKCTGCGKILAIEVVEELDYKFDSHCSVNIGTFDEFINKDEPSSMLEEYFTVDTKYLCEECFTIKDVIE